MSKPVDPKDRTVKCQSCLGILLVKNSVNEIPVCYGLTSKKELKLSDLRQGASKIHAYQYDTSAHEKTTALYFGDAFWTGLVKKTPQGPQRSLIVHPTKAINVLFHHKGNAAAPLSPSPTAKLQEQPPPPPPPVHQLDKLSKELSDPSSTSNVFISTLLNTLQRNVETCQSALTREKYHAFYGKFTGAASMLGTNLTTDFYPRFTEAGSKVAGACIKVATTTFDTVYNILTK